MSIDRRHHPHNLDGRGAARLEPQSANVSAKQLRYVSLPSRAAVDG